MTVSVFSVAFDGENYFIGETYSLSSSFSASCLGWGERGLRRVFLISLASFTMSLCVLFSSPSLVKIALLKKPP